tara:strand:- start:13 stop:324 length:312 start_codon:yes stop_codon:yes gene_type:complete
MISAPAIALCADAIPAATTAMAENRINPEVMCLAIKLLPNPAGRFSFPSLCRKMMQKLRHLQESIFLNGLEVWQSRVPDVVVKFPDVLCRLRDGGLIKRLFAA